MKSRNIIIFSLIVIILFVLAPNSLSSKLPEGCKFKNSWKISITENSFVEYKVEYENNYEKSF